MKVDSYLVLCGKMEDPNNPRADDDDGGVQLDDDDDPNNVVVDRTTVSGEVDLHDWWGLCSEPEEG